MSKRTPIIFLDVGGHLGQTLDEVLCGCYVFDMVHTFEPMPEFADRLRDVYGRHIAEGRLMVHDFGLSDRTAEVTLFGDNRGGGASVCRAKENLGDAARRSMVRMVRATEFFEAHLTPQDRVIVKLNCEGSEGAILLDLIESGLIHRIHDVMIDFDLFKVKGRRHEPFDVLRRLGDVRFRDYHLALDVMVGPTHRDRIRNWLSLVDLKVPIARIPGVFDGLPRKRRLLKRALRIARYHALGLLDASPLNRAG